MTLGDKKNLCRRAEEGDGSVGHQGPHHSVHHLPHMDCVAVENIAEYKPSGSTSKR